MYRTSSWSSSFHNQPSQIFELHYAALQQNDYPSFSFPMTQWSSRKIKGKAKKWYKMVKVNDAYNCGSHEKIRLKNLCVMSNVKIFAMQDGWMDHGHHYHHQHCSQLCVQTRYFMEVLKNGILVDKYWLKGGSYSCVLPFNRSAVLTYPKFPVSNLAKRSSFVRGGG